MQKYDEEEQAEGEGQTENTRVSLKERCRSQTACYGKAVASKEEEMKAYNEICCYFFSLLNGNRPCQHLKFVCMPHLTHFMTYKEDRQCTYNVILRRVRVTIISVEKQ